MDELLLPSKAYVWSQSSNSKKKIATFESLIFANPPPFLKNPTGAGPGLFDGWIDLVDKRVWMIPVTNQMMIPRIENGNLATFNMPMKKN